MKLGARTFCSNDLLKTRTLQGNLQILEFMYQCQVLLTSFALLRDPPFKKQKILSKATSGIFRRGNSSKLSSSSLSTLGSETSGWSISESYKFKHVLFTFDGNIHIQRVNTTSVAIILKFLITCAGVCTCILKKF